MIDTHGGYFQGQFSQQAICRVTFLGFGSFLDSLNPSDRQSALETLSQECRYKKIRVILSPERDRADILKQESNHVRQEMLST